MGVAKIIENIGAARPVREGRIEMGNRIGIFLVPEGPAPYPPPPPLIPPMEKDGVANASAVMMPKVSEIVRIVFLPNACTSLALSVRGPKPLIDLSSKREGSCRHGHN